MIINSVPHDSHQPTSNVGRLKLVINALAFQVAWFVCVQGNNVAALWVGVAVLLVHCFVFKPTAAEWRLMAMATGLGLVMDTLIINLGLMDYTSSTSLLLFTWEISLMPVWLIVLWLTFSTTLCHSMKWLLQRPALAGFMGLFVVPFSYWGGIRLSDSMVASGLSGNLFYLIEGAAWAGILVLLSKTYLTHTNKSMGLDL